jgi:hypothetical protein
LHTGLAVGEPGVLLVLVDDCLLSHLAGPSNAAAQWSGGLLFYANGRNTRYSQSMTDRRTALDKHLGLSEDDSKYASYRQRALKEHVGQALTSENYAAAQVYALLWVAEELEGRTGAVTLTNSDELAIGIASNLTPDLRRIADAIG